MTPHFLFALDIETGTDLKVRGNYIFLTQHSLGFKKVLDVKFSKFPRTF